MDESECYFKLPYGDFIILSTGAGVGWFIIGYLITNVIYKYQTRNNPQEILVAQRV